MEARYMKVLEASLIPDEPGVYVLCMRARESQEIIPGKRKVIHVDAREIYVYIGSALKGLRARVGRHLAHQGKKMHWHVDYLLQVLDIFEIFYAMTDERKECELSMQINQQCTFFTAVEGIGNSDCHSCPSHLYRHVKTDAPGALDAALRAAFDHVGLVPCILAIDSEPQTNEPGMQYRINNIQPKINAK